MLILEGPDCAGKSTLAQHLIESWPDATLAHYSSHDFPKMLQHVVSSRPGCLDIADRFHYSHVPYDMFYRGVLEPETASVRMLDRALLSRNSVYVVCLPPWPVVLDNYRQRKEEELIQSEQQLSWIYDWYWQYAANLPGLVYDYTTMSFTDFHKQLIDTMPFEIARTKPEEGAGSTKANRIIMVGEQCSSLDQHGIPFVGKGNSGEWITNQLEEAQIPEYDLYWVNVKTTEGLPNLHTVKRVITEQSPEIIVGLGGEASRALEHLDVDFEPFAHPQYWKRFKHGYDYPLIDYLKRCYCD